MKLSKALIPLALLSLLLVGVIFFMLNSKQTENIYGRALVLALVDKADDIDSIETWQKHDLALDLNNTCNHESLDKAAKCALKKINQAQLRATQHAKQLLVLAEGINASAVLSVIAENSYDDVDAFILIEPTDYKFNSDAEINSKLVLINDINSSSEELISIRRQANEIRKNNNWLWSTQLHDSGNGLFQHPVLPHIAAYLVGAATNSNYEIEFEAESRWQQPIVNNDKFWQQRAFIESNPITIDVKRILSAFYTYNLDLLKQYPLKQYHAFNLLKYRASLPIEQQGRFAVFSNMKGHKFYLDLAKYGKYQPEFVIGIDDERNLYRLTSFYRTNRFYSWEQGGPAKDMLYSHSLGAFIHFKQSPPKDEELPYLQYSSILFDSISFTDSDPYKEIAGLSNKSYKVVTLNCLPCHSIDDKGGAAHHLDYISVKPQPGYAKPLLSYSTEVLENFFYNQTETAKLIGVNPNYVEADVAEEMLVWLKAKRN